MKQLQTRPLRDEGIRPFSGISNLPFDESAGWDPFTEMSTLRRTMNSILDAALRPAHSFGTWVPPINVYEKHGQYHVECAAPGLKKDDFDIEANDNRLTISAKFDEQRNDDNSRYHYREMRQGSFVRTITFPTEIDAGRVSASYENGILKITVPNLKPITSKKVAIKG